MRNIFSTQFTTLVKKSGDMRNKYMAIKSGRFVFYQVPYHTDKWSTAPTMLIP